MEIFTAPMRHKPNILYKKNNTLQLQLYKLKMIEQKIEMTNLL